MQSNWEERTSRARTPGEALANERYSRFHRRIARGIAMAINPITIKVPPAHFNNGLKSVASGISAPTYRGEDNLETFMRWLQKFLYYLEINQLVGEANDHNRILAISQALQGKASAWYDSFINKKPHIRHREPPKFLNIILSLADTFISPAAASKAQQKLDSIVYTKKDGIKGFIQDLEMHSSHVLMPIDEYTLRKRIIDSVPSGIKNMLINFKGLSISTSSVEEWVEAIERREREIIEWEAVNDGPTPPKKSTLGNNRAPTYRNQAAPDKSSPMNMVQNNRPSPSGPRVATKSKVPLEEITCYACNKKGHYRGSKECPKTPSSARLHAMGADPESMESPAPEPEEEEPFEGVEYEGPEDTDPPMDDYDEGIAAIIASIHAEDNTSEDEPDTFDHEELATQLASLAASDPEDKVIAESIIKSVKDDYETRGSGLKPKP